MDRSGNVIVTGISDNNEGFSEYATIKYSPTGLPLWTNLYGGLVSTSNDSSSGVAVDGDGNVFVTGSSDFPGDYATIKYSSAGAPLWINRYHGPSIGGDPSFDLAAAIAVDGSGNVLVTGYSSKSGFANSDYLTIKYSGAGVPLWTNRYNGPGNESDAPLAMAVGGTGSVFVTGRTTDSVGFYDYATIAYSSEGVSLWTNRYSGTGNSFDEARAVAVDGNGDVFVTGHSWSGTSYDYVTIKYAAEVASPTLNFQRLGNNVVLNWTNAAFGLQSAPAITGTFTNIPVATSPYTNSVSGGRQFFRLAR